MPMTPERWQRITELFEAALEREPQDRLAFLAEVCSDDDGLRAEVESLLSEHREAGSFIVDPALDCKAALVNEPVDEKAVSHHKLTGQVLGHYQIIEKVREGGMGVVYKARDNRLGRSVAIKVLPPERVADVERKRRFVQEAKAASALNHPNIITIHDIATENGIDFISMEYVPGKAPNPLITRKGLPLGEAFKHPAPIPDAP